MENSQEKKASPMFIPYWQFSVMFLDSLGNNLWVSFAEMEKFNIFYLLSILSLNSSRGKWNFGGENLAFTEKTPTVSGNLIVKVLKL